MPLYRRSPNHPRCRVSTVASVAWPTLALFAACFTTFSWALYNGATGRLPWTITLPIQIVCVFGVFTPMHDGAWLACRVSNSLSIRLRPFMCLLPWFQPRTAPLRPRNPGYAASIRLWDVFLHCCLARGAMRSVASAFLLSLMHYVCACACAAPASRLSRW